MLSTGCASGLPTGPEVVWLPPEPVAAPGPQRDGGPWLTAAEAAARALDPAEDREVLEALREARRGGEAPATCTRGGVEAATVCLLLSPGDRGAFAAVHEGLVGDEVVARPEPFVAAARGCLALRQAACADHYVALAVRALDLAEPPPAAQGRTATIVRARAHAEAWLGVSAVQAGLGREAPDARWAEAVGQLDDWEQVEAWLGLAGAAAEAGEPGEAMADAALREAATRLIGDPFVRGSDRWADAVTEAMRLAGRLDATSVQQRLLRHVAEVPDAAPEWIVRLMTRVTPGSRLDAVGALADRLAEAPPTVRGPRRGLDLALVATAAGFVDRGQAIFADIRDATLTEKHELTAEAALALARAGRAADAAERLRAAEVAEAEDERMREACGLPLRDRWLTLAAAWVRIGRTERGLQVIEHALGASAPVWLFLHLDARAGLAAEARDAEVVLAAARRFGGVGAWERVRPPAPPEEPRHPLWKPLCPAADDRER